MTQTMGTEGDSSTRPHHRIVIVGHVDHGKSTIVGRLLHDTGALPPGKVEELEAMSARRGVPIEWSFVLDAFQAERDQAVTIDTTQIFFKTDRRDYVIIDAPGHREFLKNMISGAAGAETAVLVIDAKEGVREQSRRHGYLLHLLGMTQVAVAVNKMDIVGFDRGRFEQVSREIVHYLAGLGIVPTFVVPVSGREGDNIATHSERMPWYSGPPLLDALDMFSAPPSAAERPLRISVQDVYKFDERRIIVGRVDTGVLRVGDEVLFSPSNKSARVRAIEAWNMSEPPMEAHEGESVGITLDEQLFVERGDVISHIDTPPQLTTVFRGTVFWMGREPLEEGKTYKMKLGAREATVRVENLVHIIDTDTLMTRREEQLERNGVGEVVLRSRGVLAVDEYKELPRAGRFMLVDGYDTVGGGTLSMEGYPDQRSSYVIKATNITAVEHQVSDLMRARRNGHKGGVIWFTGLSGAGKSTLAMLVEQRLFHKGYHVYVLDGDNVRHGLNSNLGFTPEDRAENIRRVGEMAALFSDAGQICITSFISPYRADRDKARRAAKGRFHEIYVEADLETCEHRDPKGLYRRARAGKIRDFTGIDAPYEAPDEPELVVNTVENSIEECVGQIVGYVERLFALQAHDDERIAQAAAAR